MDDFSDIPYWADVVAKYKKQSIKEPAARAIDKPVQEEAALPMPPLDVSRLSVVVGVDVATGEQIRLSQEDRAAGLYIIGITGSGKSTLLENLIVQDIEQGLGVCVIDPHKDLITHVLNRIPRHRQQDVILLDVTDRAYAFGLNLFTCANTADPEAITDTVEQAVRIFKKAWGEGEHSSWGPQLEDVLRNCTITFVHNQGYTLTELQRLLLDKPFRQSLVANVPDKDVQLYWQWYNELPKTEQLKVIQSTLNKVRAFTTNPLLRHIVGQHQSTIDFPRILQSNKILLVFLPAKHGENTKLLGTAIISNILIAALSRAAIPESQRIPYNLYADEFQWFATPDFADLLTQVRKYNVTPTLAHQVRGSQLDEKNKKATLQARTKIVFQVIGQDADELAAQFDHTPPQAEVVGQREIQSITTAPLHHLMQNGHRNRDITKRVEQFLLPLKDFRPLVSPSNSRYATSLEPGERLTLLPLNLYLCWAMEQWRLRQTGQKEWNYDEEGTHLAEVAWHVKTYLDFPEFGHAYEPSGAEFQKYATFFAWWLWLSDTRKVGDPMNSVAPVMERFENDDAPVDKLTPRLRAVVQHGFGWRLEKMSWKGEQEREEDKELRRDVFQHWLEWFANMRYIAVEIAKDPILAGSGQHEPIYGPVRTYADMQNEIANSLTNLAPYHAYCKVRNTEYRVKTLPPPKQESPADITSIRTHSQQQYCKPRTMVEEQISGRQSNDPQTTLGENLRGFLSPGGIISPPAHANDIPPKPAEDDDEETLSDERVW